MTTLPVSTVPRTAPAERQAEPRAARQGRSLLAYLLVPRPKDLVKAVIVPLAFAVGAVSQGGVPLAQVGRAALVWVVLELLVYQARYQWNDVRGFAADQAHPDAASRGRLPGPVEKGRVHVPVSVAVAGLKLGLAAAVALAVPAVARIVLLMTVGVFGVAVVYERLRSAATGRTSQVPVPLRPALVALWVAVGAGYAVRGLTGLALAVELGGRPVLVAVAATAMWALGVVFVTCRWALEAMCFGAVRDGRLVWEVRPDQAREHTLGLLRWLPPDAVPPAGQTPCAWRALQGRTPLHAPWHLALVVASAAGVVAGALLVAPVGAGTGVLLAACGALTAVAVAATPGRRLLSSAAATVAVTAVLAAAGVGSPVVAVVPLVVVLALYGCFTRQCSDEIGQPLRRVQQLLPR